MKVTCEDFEHFLSFWSPKEVVTVEVDGVPCEFYVDSNCPTPVIRVRTNETR